LNGVETTSSFFGSTEDTFGSFSNTSDSFGSGGTDALHDAFTRADSLRESGGFSRGSGAFTAGDADSFGKQRASGAFQAVVETDKQRGSGAFQAVTEADAFGRRNSGAHKAPEDSTPPHPFGNDAFSTSESFGNTNAFGSPNSFGGDAFATNDAFGSGNGTFGTTDAFGSAGADTFGVSDAFGKSDSFGASSPFEAPMKSSGGANGVGEDKKFGDDAFGKQPDSFGTFDFTEKKDGFDF
jgi:hypothetical protein